jgi:hypothetical protein
MRRGARHEFSSHGCAQWKQLRAEGILCRSVGSDSVFERWESGDLSGEWGTGAIGKLQEVAAGAESPVFASLGIAALEALRHPKPWIAKRTGGWGVAREQQVPRRFASRNDKSAGTAECRFGKYCRRAARFRRWRRDAATTAAGTAALLFRATFPRLRSLSAFSGGWRRAVRRRFPALL